MPSHEHSTLCATISEIGAKIKRYRGRIVGAQNTKASLIEPLLEALGWDIRDFDEVHRDFRAKPSDKPVDYALKMLRRPRLFMEAKALGENLCDRKWISTSRERIGSLSMPVHSSSRGLLEEDMTKRC